MIMGILSAKVCFLWLILINISDLVVSNKDIPICYKLWKTLGQDMVDWRKQCFDGDVEKDSAGCKAQKEYFEERRRTHGKMCFYEGNRFFINFTLLS